MNRNRQKWLDYSTLVITLMLSLVLIVRSARIEQQTAVQKWSLQLVGTLGTPLSYFKDLSSIRKENQRLKQRNIELQLENSALVEERLENHRLKSLLELREKIPFNSIPARVIGMDGMVGVHSLVLDKGSADSVHLHMPVVSSNGLLGKIVRLSANHSVVQAITDKNFRAAARTREGRVTGILQGTGERYARLWGVPLHEKVKSGQQVITSGLHSMFPDSIFLGTIIDISADPGGLFYDIKVETAENYTNVEQVLILDFSGGE